MSGRDLGKKIEWISFTLKFHSLHDDIHFDFVSCLRLDFHEGGEKAATQHTSAFLKLNPLSVVFSFVVVVVVSLQEQLRNKKVEPGNQIREIC